jgi:hypothetical protein
MRRMGVPLSTGRSRPRPNVGRLETIPVREDVPPAHFLRIGKTGGTGLRLVLNPLTESGPFSVRMHPHGFTLPRVPEGEVFFFTLRDPVERFVSGFYCRQRRGWPIYDVAWSDHEKVAFERFPSANALALALTSERDDERAAAEEAMRHVQHLNSVWRWFRDEETFRAREPFLLKVLFADRLDEDFADLVRKLGLESFHPVLPHDDVHSYRAPTKPDPLDDDAVENLRRWYARDYEFLEYCRNLEAQRAVAQP